MRSGREQQRVKPVEGVVEPQPDQPQSPNVLVAEPDSPVPFGRNFETADPTVQKLGLLFSSLREKHSVPFSREFEVFLSTTREAEKLESLLKVEDGKLIVRALENPKEDHLLALLAAVYSYFNRTLEQVDDSHERAFHQALVQFAIRR